MEKLIKEALPSAAIRVQKESTDLICHLANQFVQLIADIANNVCNQHEKKVMFPEHMLRALQELHLDEYLPYLLKAE